MKYLSAFEATKEWNISAKCIALLCSKNRMEGAQKVSNNWTISADTQKPADARIKTRKYRKNQTSE